MHKYSADSVPIIEINNEWHPQGECCILEMLVFFGENSAAKMSLPTLAAVGTRYFTFRKVMTCEE